MIVRSTCAKITGKIAEVTVIEAGWSANGEHFSVPILERAVEDKHFEGLAVHAYGLGERYNGKTKFSHTSDDVYEIHQNGLWKNKVGHLRNVQMGVSDKGIPAIVGEVHIATDEDAQRLVADQDADDLPELSVDITTTRTEGIGGLYVTEITKANSFDFVEGGAAGGKINRLIAELGSHPTDRTQSGQEFTDMEPKAISSTHGLRDQYPDLSARMVEEAIKPIEERFSEVQTEAVESAAEVTRLTESNAKLEADLAEARTALANYEAENGSLKAEKESIENAAEMKRLTEGLTDLPAWFITQLESSDAETREAMIADRKARTTESKTEVTGHGGASKVETDKRTTEAEEAEAFTNLAWFGRKPETKSKEASA